MHKIHIMTELMYLCLSALRDLYRSMSLSINTAFYVYLMNYDMKENHFTGSSLL